MQVLVSDFLLFILNGTLGTQLLSSCFSPEIAFACWQGCWVLFMVVLCWLFLFSQIPQQASD